MALNLEVVRSRVARSAEPGAIAPFADAAAEELERAVVLVEALLALARAAPQPVDLWGVARPLGTLHAGLFATQGGMLSIEAPATTLPPAGGDPTAVRLACEAAFDAVTREPAVVRCSTKIERGAPVLVLAGARNATIDGATIDAVAGAGVHVRATADGLSVICTGAGQVPGKEGQA